MNISPKTFQERVDELQLTTQGLYRDATLVIPLEDVDQLISSYRSAYVTAQMLDEIHFMLREMRDREPLLSEDDVRRIAIEVSRRV